MAWTSERASSSRFFFAGTEYPTDGHVDRTLTVHFKLEAKFRGERFFRAALNLMCVKGGDQFEVMVAQAVLCIVFKSCLKKQSFLLNVMEFIDKPFVDRAALPHVFKGLGQDLVEVQLIRSYLSWKLR